MYFRLQTMLDEHSFRPDQDDGRWRIYTFDQDKDRDKFRPTPIWLRKKLSVGLAFLLRQFGDGTFVMTFEATGDVTALGGLMVWEEPAKNIGAKSYTARQNDARRELTDYNAWLRGDVLGYRLTTNDDREISSCHGFYDQDYMLDEIADVIRWETTGRLERSMLIDYGDRPQRLLSRRGQAYTPQEPGAYKQPNYSAAHCVVWEDQSGLYGGYEKSVLGLPVLTPEDALMLDEALHPEAGLDLTGDGGRVILRGGRQKLPRHTGLRSRRTLDRRRHAAVAHQPVEDVGVVAR